MSNLCTDEQVYTRCCGRPINGRTDRFCPSCGMECHITDDGHEAAERRYWEARARACETPAELMRVRREYETRRRVL